MPISFLKVTKSRSLSNGLWILTIDSLLLDKFEIKQTAQEIDFVMFQIG